MKRNDIIGEHKKGVKAVKYNAKPKTHSEPPKPRNPVAKNASATIGGGGAGAHKDKKKAAKQGDVKHKKAPELAEVSLGNYRDKALKQKAQSQMGAIFARDPAEREKNTATFYKREKGLNRLKARDEKARKADQERQLADLVGRLPELKAEYAAMKDKYKSLGGSNWQYADREQNLTDREREARSMEGPMNNLWRQISAAEKAQGSSNEATSVGEEAPIAGKVSQVTAKDVTIDDPTQGIKITAPINRLVKDATGKLTLTKPAAGAALGAVGAQSQQDKIQAGAAVSIQPDAMEESDVVSPRFAGVQNTQHADGSKTTDYQAGPLQTTNKVDAQGRPVTSKAKYDLGVGTVDSELDHASGIRSNAITTRGGMDPNKLAPTADIAGARGVDPKKFAAFQKQNPSAVNESIELTAILQIAGLR
jgi:hypothetical protein